MSKECKRCNCVKDESEFNKKSSSKDGLQSYCKSCRKQIDAYSYANNKYRKIKIRENSNILREKNSEYINEYKHDHGCIFCGENEPISLDFHHVNDDKKYNVSNIVKYSHETVKAEIEKCIVLCANCHRKLHAGILKLNL